MCPIVSHHVNAHVKACKMPMKDALCSDVINGFRSGSGPHLTELETRMVVPSNNSVCVRIMLEPRLDGKRDWKNVVVKKNKVLSSVILLSWSL